MSKIDGFPERRRRADAQRSRIAVLEAAIALLGRRPEAGMEEIASAAGVSRQTVYAHYTSREALLLAVQERIMSEASAVLLPSKPTRAPRPSSPPCAAG